MTETLRLGRIAGIRVGVNWTVFVIFLLIAVGLAAVQLPALHPGLSSAVYVTAGIATGLVFFVSLLAHEIAHTIVARRNGVPVSGVTLWLLGGMTRLRGEPPTPGASIRIAAAGPAVSLVLGLGFSAIAIGMAVFGATGLVPGLVRWLAAINVILAAFNLIPASPLDGGRILQGLLWKRSGHRYKAAITAARAGRVFGWLLIGVGLADFVTYASGGGVWLVFVGWFLTVMAGAERDQARTSQLLGALRVGEVMTPQPITVSPDLSVGDLLDRYVFLARRHSTFPVVDSLGRMKGLVTLKRLKKVPADRRASTTVSDVACPAEDVPTAAPDDQLAELIPNMSGCSDGRALVVDRDRVVGIVSTRDVAHQIEVAELRRSLPGAGLTSRSGS